MSERNERMYEYIKGKKIEMTPTEIIVEAGGIGYSAAISLQTYDSFQGLEEVKVYLHHHIHEDDEEFYGFATKEERELFRQLISVNGIGVGTARVMLSSLTTNELKESILTGDVNRIKSVKGIGLKTAQRVIIDLKDKLVKGADENFVIPTGVYSDSAASEATNALLTLGFSRPNIAKVINPIIKKKPDISVEELIKEALRKL